MLALVLMVLIEVLGIKAGAFEIIFIVLGVLLLLLVASQYDLNRLALIVLAIATFTFTWNGLFVGPVRPGDVLALLALILFAAGYDGGHVPKLAIWIGQLAFAILFLMTLHLAFPESTRFLDTRIVLNAKGQVAVSTKGAVTSAEVGVAVKFVVAVAVIPLAYVWAAIRSPKSVRLLTILFGIGAALSGFVAFLERIGIPTIDKILLHGKVLPGASRQIGLADHPNFLAAGLVLAMPIGIWLLSEGTQRFRLLGAWTTGGCLLGVYASGSRGGIVCVVLAIGVSLFLIPRARPYVPASAMGVLALVGAAYIYAPGVVLATLRSVRLIGGISTSGSDAVRALVGHQATLDVLHSPITGIGLQVASEAQNVYLQELASGGLILFGSMMIFSIFALIHSYGLIKVDEMAAALCASIVATLALNFFEADLTDRFYYVPAALIAAMIAAQRRTDELAAEAVQEAAAATAEASVAAAQTSPGRRRAAGPHGRARPRTARTV